MKFVYIVRVVDWDYNKIICVCTTREKAEKKVEEHKRRPLYQEYQFIIDKFNLVEDG